MKLCLVPQNRPWPDKGWTPRDLWKCAVKSGTKPWAADPLHFPHGEVRPLWIGCLAHPIAWDPVRFGVETLSLMTLSLVHQLSFYRASLGANHCTPETPSQDLLFWRCFDSRRHVDIPVWRLSKSPGSLRLPVFPAFNTTNSKSWLLYNIYPSPLTCASVTGWSVLFTSPVCGFNVTSEQCLYIQLLKPVELKLTFGVLDESVCRCSRTDRGALPDLTGAQYISSRFSSQLWKQHSSTMPRLCKRRELGP